MTNPTAKKKNKYYAAYKGWEEEIVVFRTEYELNKWVNYIDPLSKSIGQTKENAILKREKINRTKAEKLIKEKNMRYAGIDTFGGAWYKSEKLALCR